MPPPGIGLQQVTLIMVGFFMTEATIKSKHFRREELHQMEDTHVFGNGRWRPNSCFMGRKEEKLQTLTLSPLLGGSSLGGPLVYT